MAYEVKTDYGTFHFDKEPSHDDIDEAIASVQGSTKAPETSPKLPNKDSEGNDYGNVDAQAEKRMGLKSGFLNALGHHESGNNSKATNPDSSAYGRFQMTDAAWKDVGYDSKNMDKKDPHIQSQAAGAYFANILNGPANGDYDLALRMYYQGPGASHDKLYGKDADKYVNDPVFSQFRNKTTEPEVKQPETPTPTPAPSTTTPVAPVGHEMDIPGNPTTPPEVPIRRDDNGAPQPSVENESWLDKAEGVGEAALSTVTGMVSGAAGTIGAVLEGKGPERAAELSQATTYQPTTGAGIRYTNAASDFMTNVAQPLLNEIGFSGAHPSLSANDATVATRGAIKPTSALPDTLAALQREKLVQTSAKDQIAQSDELWKNTPEGSVRRDIAGSQIDASDQAYRDSAAKQRDIEKSSGVSLADAQAVDAKISVLRDLNANGFKGGVGMLKKTAEDKALFKRVGVDTHPLAKVFNGLENIPGGEHVTKAIGVNAGDAIPKRQAALIETATQKMEQIVPKLDLADNNFHDSALVAPFEALKAGDVVGARKSLDRLDGLRSNPMAEFTVGDDVATDIRNYAHEMVKQSEATAKKATKKSGTQSMIEDTAYSLALPVLTGIATHGVWPAVQAFGVRKGVSGAYSALINRHAGRELQSTAGSVSVPNRLTSITPPPVFSSYQGDRK